MYVNLDNKNVKVLSEGDLIESTDVINFIEGSNVTISAVADSDNKRVNVTISSSGGGGGSGRGYFPQGWG